MVCAWGPSAMRTSTWNSSMAGYRNSSRAGRRRWISSMNRMSPALSDVSRPTRSPGRSSTGPEVVRTFTPSSRAMSSASVVLPSPGGPKNRAWSRGSLRCFVASMAIWSDSLTLAWPTNSSRREGRSAASVNCQHVTQRAVRFGGAISQPLQRLEGRLGSAVPGRRRRASGPRLLKLAELVGEFKREALGGFLADAAHRRQQRDVPLLQRPCSPLHPQRGHQRDGELRPDAGDADESLEEAPLGLVPESVQRPAVLPDDELGGETDGLADGRQLLHDAERDGDRGADPARGVDHDAVGLFRGEASADLGDHARRMWVSATATPSAASAGVGACFSLS